MLGDLAIAYLFLGGAGAGALLVCCLVDLIWLREPFGCERLARGLSRWPVERLVGLSMLTGLLMVCTGIACLAFDLGRADRLVSLLLTPPNSLMNWGSWALVVLVVLGGFLVLARFLSLPSIGRRAVVAAEVMAVAVALFVAAYTGFLLQTLSGVRFWGLWPVVALFVLSSVSCGIAVPVLMQAVVPVDEFTERLARTLVKADMPVIALEALAAAALLLLAAGSQHPGIQASLEALLRGDAALWWWAGFVVCGLLAPLASEVAALVQRAPQGALRLSVAAAVLVLMGGMALRMSIVGAGSYRPLELDTPAIASYGTAAQEDARTAGESANGGDSGSSEAGDSRGKDDFRDDDAASEDGENWGAHLFSKARQGAEDDKNANSEEVFIDGFVFTLQ